MACKCDERFAPFKSGLPEGSNERPRQWFVIRRHESCSAFTGYRRQWSEYSDVACRVCGSHWRTKADFVDELEDCTFWPKDAPRAEKIARVDLAGL